ncbi:EDD domain protein, DegV family [Anaerobranca californiensis DSM 14826]|jgi:DegV family protein with EDD domain|uniref:EDD domain protein, DegV family n=1 Tax=Anaerobranca californiensis DSM 14826 TaxID=1120989 RepID=A0A1M6KN49_9FIRM|nr:DegV family protein [Anaerobranca californiensis]SHJ60340.1 EDD domain protein, DegV family [Anaerobranca californiensis DSM 14826]
MAIKLVVDSTADLSKDIIEKYDITVVPLNVHFGDEVFKDGIDLNTESFFAKLQNSEVMPRTSQPSPGDFHKVYTSLLSQGHSIISIHISDNLSGTYQSAVIAKNMLENADITIIDSKSASLGLGLIAYQGAKLIEQGKDVREIQDILNKIIEDQLVCFGVDTLEFLQKNGRIGKASALIGTLLNVKPILTLNSEGIVAPLGKVRGRNKVIPYLVEKIKERFNDDLVNVAIAHALTPEQKDELLAYAKQELNINEILEGNIGSVIGTNTGPGMIAIAAHKKIV